MFCPQCGLESSSGQQYCRSCGANLKVIGKAVTLSEAIARTDRGPLPKIKEMMKNLKVEQVSEDVSHALDQMNQEIVKHSGSLASVSGQHLEKLIERRRGKKEKSAQQRRERHITRGLVSLFSGAGLMIFLYFLSSVLVLKLPPDIVVEAPFEIDPVVRIIWLIGLIPTLTGLGRILAGLTIRPEPAALPAQRYPTDDLRSEISDLKSGSRSEISDLKSGSRSEISDLKSGSRSEAPDLKSGLRSEISDLKSTNELENEPYQPPSVTERTTNILNRR